MQLYPLSDVATLKVKVKNARKSPLYKYFEKRIREQSEKIKTEGVQTVVGTHGQPHRLVFPI